MSLWPPLLSFPVDSLLSNPDLTKVPKRRFMPPLISSMHFQIYVERNKLSVKKKKNLDILAYKTTCFDA